MSNSNGYNPNSLFALEHSLLGNNPAYRAEQFSDEEMEEFEEDRSRGVEAQAFDWDDAIALEYEEDTDPESESMSQQDAEELEDEEDTARPMSWQNYGYASRGFDVEEEETEDPLSQSNSLFALEQSVFGVTPSYQPSQQFSLEEEEELPSESIESQAFDWDDAIALEYSETLYPTSMSLDWQPSDYPSESFRIEDEPSTYDVEAFEMEEESEAAPTNEDYPSSAVYGFDADDDVPVPPDESSDNSQAYAVDADDDLPEPTSQKDRDSAAIPVNATVVMPPIPPRKSAQPVEALSDDDFDEFDRGTVSDRSSDSEAFAADLAAILRGEKVYEPPAETPAPPPPLPQPQTQPAPQSQAQSVPPKKSSPHDIFDQMGRNMAHATAFDLGTFSLEQRFDEFDALLDAQESESLSQLEDVQSSAPEDTFETAGSFAFDDDELEADVAALSAGAPWQATQFGLDDDAIDNLVKSNQPSKKDIQEKFSNYFKRLKLSAKKLPGYDAKTDDVKIQAAIKKIWKSADSAPAKSGKIAIEAPKITGEDLKKRYWHHISIGGTQSNPKDLSGYHWSGYEDNQAMFKRIGKPTKEDVFGIYKQYVQQKGTTNIKKDASSFFPDTWTEQHFDDLFNHFAQRRDFKSNKGGTYEILAAIGGDDKYKSMRVTFMPNAQGGSCVPVYVHEKDRDVQTQLMLNIDPDPEVAQMQSPAQMLGQEFSSSPYEEMYAELGVDETDSLYGDVYTALGTDESPPKISYATSADNLWSSSLELWSGSMDLAATGFVDSFGITSGTTGESFDLRYDVPLIPQQTGMSAWAAAAAMLIAWRDQLSTNPSDIIQGIGPWATYKSVLQAEDPSSFKTWGTIAKPATTYTIEGLVKLILEADGPLWVASDPPGAHVRVVTGIVGNGTPEETLLLINDPWKAGMTTFQMPNPGGQYTETYQQFVQKQPLLARQKPNTQGIYVAYLQDPIGSIKRAKAAGGNEDIDED